MVASQGIMMLSTLRPAEGYPRACFAGKAGGSRLTKERKPRRPEEPGSAGPPLRWPTQSFLKLGLLCMGAALGLILVETGFRILGIGSEQFFAGDPVLGVRPAANRRGPSSGACFRAQVSNNAHGWRDLERSIEKPEGVFRILVLGDSFIQALQVNDDQTLTQQLERFLNRHAVRKKVEVLNMSCASWGNDQEYLAFKAYGLRYSPDLVVLAFYAQNDVIDNSRSLIRRDSAFAKPFFRLENDRLVEIPITDRPSHGVHPVRTFISRFRTLRWLRDKGHAWPALHRLMFRLGLTSVVPPEGNAPRYPTVWGQLLNSFASKTSAEWESAWRLTEAIVLNLRQKVHDAGADFLLLELAPPLAVMPNELRREHLSRTGREDFDFDGPHRRLVAFTQRERIEFFSLQRPFRERIGESKEMFESLFLYCDGHYTAAGHRLAAEALAQYLSKSPRWVSREVLR